VPRFFDLLCKDENQGTYALNVGTVPIKNPPYTPRSADQDELIIKRKLSSLHVWSIAKSL
jgi:hypothetical protein